MNCEICRLTFTRLKDLMLHITSEKHDRNDLYCLPCAFALHSVADVAEHISSTEHIITVLATGVRFETGHKSSAISSGRFPPHNCCFLCSNRDGTPDNPHLTSDYHQYTAWLLRTIIRTKKIYCNNSESTLNTRVFLSRLINLKNGKIFAGVYEFQETRGSLSFVCELCNLHFNKQESYNQHLDDQSHKRMKKFLIELSHILKEITVIGGGFYLTATKTFSNSFRPLYYCEECDMWIDTNFNYVQHRESNKHKRVASIQRRCVRMQMADIKLSCFAPEPVAHSSHSYRKSKSSLQGDAFLDSYGESSSKRLRLSPSPQTRHSSAICRKHKTKRQSRLVKKKKCHCSKHLESVSDTSSSIDSDDDELTEFSRRRAGLDAVRNFSRLQRGAETVKMFSPEFCVEAEETARKCYPVPSPNLSEASGNSTVRLDHTSSDTSSRLEDNRVNVYTCKDSLDDTEVDQEHYCELCEFLTYNSSHYEKHLKGEQHKRMRKLINKKERKVNTDAPEGCETASGKPHYLQYNCELCDIFNRNSQEYEFHLSSAVHRKNQWLLYVLKQRP